MLSISATDNLRKMYPGAVIGLLEVSHVEQAQSAHSLDEHKRNIEQQLRERYAGFTRRDFLALPVISAYDLYYRHFGKTYHVLQQVESIVHKGKNLPAVSPLVDSNFMAEVDTLILTAGHDVDRLSPPVVIDIAGQEDEFIQMGGALKSQLAGDMLMRDAHGVCCSVIYGQDIISPISPATSHALYVSYAPAGVPPSQVELHMQTVVKYIRSFSPGLHLEQQTLLAA